MSEWIQELFATIFGTNSWLATLIIAMIPIVELRGAIPFGAATGFWGQHALELWQSFLISFAGSSFVCIILTFLFLPILNWFKKTKFFKKLALAVERKLNKNAEGINSKTKTEKDAKRIKWLKLIGIFGFVAIPLPLTGVWTGTCLALFIGLNKRETMITVILGNLVAGLIMTLISYFFADNTAIVLYIFLIIVLAFVLFGVVKLVISKIKKKKNKVAEENASSETLEENSENQNDVASESLETGEADLQEGTESGDIAEEMAETEVAQATEEVTDKPENADKTDK